MKAVTFTKLYVRCPACGEGEHQVCHLFNMPLPKKAGPWHCEECGKWFDVTVNTPDDIQTAPSDIQRDYAPANVVLRLPPQEKPLYFALKTHEYGGDEHQKFFYEEHTCPTNWTGNIEMMLIDGDSDPHGLFEYVGMKRVEKGFFERQDTDEEIISIINAYLL